MTMNKVAIVTAFSVLAIIACSNEPVEPTRISKENRAGEPPTIIIDVFAKKACGATEPTIALVKDIIGQMDVSSELNITILNSRSQAIDLKIIGVPTIRINGVDINPATEQVQKYGIT